MAQAHPQGRGTRLVQRTSSFLAPQGSRIGKGRFKSPFRSARDVFIRQRAYQEAGSTGRDLQPLYERGGDRARSGVQLRPDDRREQDRGEGRVREVATEQVAEEEDVGDRRDGSPGTSDLSDYESRQRCHCWRCQPY